jgi:hypothetical protein
MIFEYEREHCHSVKTVTDAEASQFKFKNRYIASENVKIDLNAIRKTV